VPTPPPASRLQWLTCSLHLFVTSDRWALQWAARAYKSCISSRLSLFRVAAHCTALRSRWCRSSVRLSRILLRLGTFSGQVYDLSARLCRALWACPPYVGVLRTAMVKGTKLTGYRSTLPTVLWHTACATRRLGRFPIWPPRSIRNRRMNPRSRARRGYSGGAVILGSVLLCTDYLDLHAG
jgi:hypothetical protein